jgi:hypothetical protein
MEWQINQRSVCKAIGLGVSGHRSLLGYEIEFGVRLTTYPWQWQGNRGLLIEPVAAGIEIQAGTDRASLGEWRAAGKDTVSMMSHVSEETIRFCATLTGAQVQRIEDFRSGRGFTLHLAMHGRAYANGLAEQGLTQHYASLPIDIDQWRAVLGKMGFCDVLNIEIPIPQDSAELSAAVGHLRQALGEYQQGRHVEAVAACRLAANALTHGGFGKNAPQEVINFIKAGSKGMSLSERFSALHAALELYCSPAHHHPGPQRDDYGRLDALLVIAAAAGLVSLAPVRGRAYEEKDEG